MLQLRKFKRQRQEAVALDLMRAGPGAEKAATLMCTTFEGDGRPGASAIGVGPYRTSGWIND